MSMDHKSVSLLLIVLNISLRALIEPIANWLCIVRQFASSFRLSMFRTAFSVEPNSVLRYRSHLESRQLAPGTINLPLGAMRRLAYEAADCGLLSADLVAGIRRVKGVKSRACDSATG